MFTKIQFTWKRIDYQIRGLIFFGILLLISIVVLLFIEGGGSINSCELQYDTSYKLLYIGAPVSYKSDTHKVIWMENGCGHNIWDLYEIFPQKEGNPDCTTVMINKDGEGPFFEIYLPSDWEEICPSKPATLTLEAPQ